VLLKPEYFRAQELVLEGVEKELMDLIKSERRIDGSVRAAIEKKLPSWEKQDNGTILYNGLIYVPGNKELRDKIIGLRHNPAIVGHPGGNRTQELVERNYWWLRLGNGVSEYIKTIS
jgi:hypothetical protein